MARAFSTVGVVGLGTMGAGIAEVFARSGLDVVAVEKANALPYGLGGAVFGKANGIRIARRLRTGMVAVNSTLTFVGMAALPFGGVGDSGFGRVHGEDGLREFARTKAVAVRRGPSLLPAATFERTPAHVRGIVRALKLLYGRKR